MKITNNLIGRRVRLKGDPKDEWIEVIGISEQLPDQFIGWNQIGSIVGDQIDLDWELIPESKTINFLTKVLTWCLEKLSPFRAWYDNIRRSR